MTRPAFWKSARRTAIAGVAIVLMSLTLAIAVRKSVELYTNYHLLQQTKTFSLEITRYFNDNLSARIGDSFRRGLLEELKVLAPDDMPGEVVLVRLFDKRGYPILDSSADRSWAPPLEARSTDAMAVIEDGEVLTKFVPRVVDGRTQYLTEAYVPLLDTSGNRDTALELHFDMTDAYTFFLSSVGTLNNLLTLGALLLYAVPSVAFAYQTEKRRQRDEALAYVSRFDTLTGLCNRSALLQEVARIQKAGDVRDLGLILMDIDDLHRINEEFGNLAGDDVLRDTASVITNVTDAGHVTGRNGGNEFLIAIPNATEAALSDYADALLTEFRRPLLFRDKKITRQVSIGLYLAPSSEPLDTSMHAVDVALRHAKATGKNRAVLYTPDLDESLSARRDIEAALTHAIEEDAIELLFQPLVSGQTCQPQGFEALARLSTSDGRPISPVDFIPVAEDTGQIAEFGRLVLRRALRVAANWPRDVSISVNLSPVQFRGDIASAIQAELAAAEFEPDRLELEVTESLFLEATEEVEDQLLRLRDLGVRLALDDFGTGYSSLGYLWNYAFDKLKVDRIFLQTHDTDLPRHRDIIETICILAHKMGMRVTMEGVETPQQVEMLQSMKADQFQGYFFGKPMSAQDATNFLRQASLRTA